MTLIPRVGEPVATGRVVYLSDEFSFDTVGQETSGVTSVLVNDVNIDFDESRKAISVWGLCPHTSWTEGVVPKPGASRGVLHLDGETVPGVATRANKNGQYWPVIFDSVSGWLRLGEDHRPADNVIEFLEGCVAVVRDGEVVGLYLHVRQ